MAEHATTEARPSALARTWNRPLWCHLVALAVVLLALGLVVRPSGRFISDEGAAVAQAQSVADGSWTIPHPLPEADPDGSAFPFEKSTAGEDGFAPLAKHPAYPALLAYQPFGVAGMVVWSMVGTLLAALLSARVARRIEPSLERWALWVVGLSSPLLFYAFIVKAHSLAAAAATGATLLVLQAAEDRRWSRVVGATALLGLATLLRTEGLLYAGALAAVVGAVGLRRRDPLLVAASASAVVGAAGAYVVDRLVSGALVPGSEVVARVGGSSGDGTVGGRAAAALRTLLRSGYETSNTQLAVFAGLLLLTIAAVLVRRHPNDGGPITALIWLAAGVLAFSALREPGLVPGLFAAFPLMAAGLVLAVGRFDTDAARWSWWVVVGFAAAVLATQYDESGGTEWGARYLALALPLLVPLALLGIRAGAQRVQPAVARRVLPALVVVGLALPVASLSTIADGQERAQSVLDSAVEAAAAADPGDGGRSVVVTTDTTLGRLAWSALDEARWLYAPVEELPALGGGLAQAKITEVVVVSPPGVLESDLDGFEEQRQVSLDSGWTATYFGRVGAG